MSDIPVPRSFQQILGEQVDAFLSKQGVGSTLRVGSPILSILEAASASDFRSSMDLFTILNAISLDSATGLALERIGNDESLPKLQASAATGTVSISDSSFVKKASKIYQGSPAPIIGSNHLDVADALSWPSTGSVYIGRGGTTYEGALAYSAKINMTSFWRLTLSGTTTRFHNTLESVILAQGGNRTIGPGTVVRTPQANISSAVEFKTLFSVTLPDGETDITGVNVQASLPGTIGNVPANSIVQFASNPFVGATVNNPGPFSNGLETEGDDAYRSRIKDVRATRARGTVLAITTAVTGITAKDENKRVTSASFVARTGTASTLYIDDGTGYEEKSAGVAIETLMDSATGGEQYFESTQRPIAKASVTTQNAAPYTLVAGASLTVNVGGVGYTHNFSAADFISIGNATAYEIAASINSNSNIAFLARTTASGTKVKLASKYDTNEDVEVVASEGLDANTALGFPAGRNYTIQLYKNDRLLTKDGVTASYSSNHFGQWGTFSGAVSFAIQVDGTFPNTYTFVDQDFVDAGTGFTSVGDNSIDAWVAVINNKVAGVIARANNGTILLTSNSGPTARSAITISDCDLVSARVFNTGTVVGAQRDYTMDRNVGQIRLETALSAGDSLTIGSKNTRAFLESSVVTPSTLATTGRLWFVVDGDAEIISHGLTSSSSITRSLLATYSWGVTVKFLAAAGEPFIDVVAGDYVILWDTAIPSGLRGAFRIVEKANTFFVIERPVGVDTLPATFTLPQLGIAFVRCPDGVLKETPIAAAANYTATSFSTALNLSLLGATASAYRTSKIRINTNSFSPGGDITLVTSNTAAAPMHLIAAGVSNISDHVGSVETGSSELGTPTFEDIRVILPGAGVGIVAEALQLTTDVDADTGYGMVGLRDWDTLTVRPGNNQNFHTRLVASDFVSGTTDTRTSGIQPWAIQDRVYMAAPYAIGPQDDLSFLVDNDANKTFGIKMARKLATVNNTYSASNDFTDVDAGNVSIAATFGMAFDFNDFAVYMAPRAIAFSATAAALLIRYYRQGLDGDGARVRFSNPVSPLADVGVSVNIIDLTASTDIRISLKGGVLRTPTVRATSRIGTQVVSVASGVGTLRYILNLTGVAAARTSNITTLTPTLPSGITNHGLLVDDIVYIASTDVNFSSGAKAITARTNTTFAYTEVAANFSASNIGTVSFDSQGEVTTTGGGIIASDFVHLLNPAGTISANFAGFTGYVTGVTASVVTATSGEKVESAATTTIVWAALTTAADFQVFANPTQTAAQIITAVNALAAVANSKAPVTLTSVGAGTGTITKSTPEFLSDTNAWYTLNDGLNYVQKTVIPGSPSGNYTLYFKDPITGTLTTSADWANEIVYIAPTTAKNVKDWLSAPTVSGLFTACDIVASSAGTKVQISSKTAGSTGGVQVQGGLANSLTATIVGGLRTTNGVAPVRAVNTIRRSDADGLRAGMWCAVQNTLGVAKVGVFTGSTNVVGWLPNGNFAIATTPLYTVIQAKTDTKLQFERQGRYIAISEYGLTAVDFSTTSPGDYVRLKAAVSPTAFPQTTTPNLGIFRIVRVAGSSTGSGGTVWIEHSDGVPEVSECNVATYTGDSVIPGDKFVVSTPLLGTENQGIWTVERVGFGGGDMFNSAFDLDVSTSSRTPVLLGSVGALGTASALVKIIEGTPCKFVLKIDGLIPNQDDGTYMDIRWGDVLYSSTISEAAGSILTALDKLSFPLEFANGADGYAYGTGLIGEANRVVQGDPSDTSNYPGVAAAGSQIQVSGPLVKRIQVSLSLRIRTGVPSADVADRVRSAVATVINQTGIGQPVALSAVVAAASRVVGVVAITVVSPSFGIGSDLIEIQPAEKALVLDLSQDIQISFVE